MGKRVFSNQNLINSSWKCKCKSNHVSMMMIPRTSVSSYKLSPFINLLTVVSTDLQYEVVAYLSELSMKRKFHLNRKLLGHNYIQQNRNFKAVINLLTVLGIEIDFRWTDWCSLPSALRENLLSLADNNWYYL